MEEVILIRELFFSVSFMRAAVPAEPHRPAGDLGLRAAAPRLLRPQPHPPAPLCRTHAGGGVPVSGCSRRGRAAHTPARSRCSKVKGSERCQPTSDGELRERAPAGRASGEQGLQLEPHLWRRCRLWSSLRPRAQSAQALRTVSLPGHWTGL